MYQFISKRSRCEQKLFLNQIIHYIWGVYLFFEEAITGIPSSPKGTRFFYHSFINSKRYYILESMTLVEGRHFWMEGYTGV